MDIVGKVVARIIHEKLQDLAEQEFPELQCGFRMGCGCFDMIFTVCQSVEKTWKHPAKLVLVYIDLKKAYDPSLPKNCGWRCVNVESQNQKLKTSYSFTLICKPPYNQLTSTMD